MNESRRHAAGQALTIARATFDGFLQSDLVPAGMQAPALIWAAAFLVGPALFFPAQFMAKYPYLRRYFPARVEPALWDDRMLFILLSAGAMGLVSVVLWDTLFPARRDVFVLTPLPVPLSVQMLGRLGGLLGLCVVFIVALNAVPAFTFSFVAAATFSEIPRWMIGHLVSTTSADAFVFFTVTSLQGIVILAFGRRPAARLGALVQAIAVLVLLLTLLFISPIRDFTRTAILRGDASAPGLLSPVSWFLGLCELVTGTARPLMATLATRGLLAGALPVAATIAIYAFGYRKLLARAVETPPGASRSVASRAVSRIVRTAFVRRPEEQAICAFLLRAIARSGRHSMLMSIYIGAGLALIVTAILPEVTHLGQAALAALGSAWHVRATPPIAVLAAPLIFSVALAVGVRVLITIPAEMGARWVFQTSPISPRRVDAALHKAMLLIVLAPVLLMAGGSAWVLWGGRLAAQHTAFCGSLTLLLCELLLLGYRGLPLTRPYVPGRSRFHIFWALYLSAFLTYTYSMAWLERDFGGEGGAWNASVFFTAAAAALWLVRKYRIGKVEEIPYEAEIPDDEMFQGFNLTEIYTAQAVAGRAKDLD